MNDEAVRQRFQRDVNCLADPDRSTRKRALLKLRAEFAPERKEKEKKKKAKKKKPKKPIVIVEQSSSDSEDDQQVVYVKKKSKKKDIEAAPIVQPQVEQQPDNRRYIVHNPFHNLNYKKY